MYLTANILPGVVKKLEMFDLAQNKRLLFNYQIFFWFQ